MIRVERLSGWLREKIWSVPRRNGFFHKGSCIWVRWECHFTTEVSEGTGVRLRGELWPMAARREELTTCLAGMMGCTSLSYLYSRIEVGEFNVSCFLQVKTGWKWHERMLTVLNCSTSYQLWKDPQDQAERKLCVWQRIQAGCKFWNDEQAIVMQEQHLTSILWCCQSWQRGLAEDVVKE